MLYFLMTAFLLANPVVIDPGQEQLELKIRQMEYFEDRGQKLDFEAITEPAFQQNFRINPDFRPQDYKTSSVYWVRLDLQIPESDDKYLIEFFDQTIDSLSVYIKHERESAFKHYEMGDYHPFIEKAFLHKNFEILLPEAGNYLCYFRVKSHEYADIRVGVRTYSFFVHYALYEYFLYGILYGMIVIISLYNMLIYTAIREIKYLYYTFYIISVAVFAMSVDGVAYQFLWPENAGWNQIAHGVALYMVIFWAVFFSKKFLGLSIRSPRFDLALNVIFGLRTLWFLYCLGFNNSAFEYRQVELIPLTVIFVGSISVFNRGYKPARFFIVAFGFLFVGFFIRALMSVSIIPFTTLAYYSLHISFVFEMLFLTFALSDRVRILKANRDRAMRRIITQHEENIGMKDQMNRRLEELVTRRTLELKEKNELLESQKMEISEINSLLDLDNFRLRNDIKTMQVERLQNKEMTFEEFSEVFTTQEDCLQALSNLKWEKAYNCQRCSNETFASGTTPLSRRCSKCGYQESPTTHTVFHGLRFPLPKAFYILYEMLHEEQYSLSQLSEILDLRKNTIMDFKKKVRNFSLKDENQLYAIFTKTAGE